ncbi:MAG: NYN domain-containing protein [Anaerovoracaceae bacterium]
MKIKSDKLIVGILAHVDAGKTTLSESLLYKSGTIRKQGRVDHGDAFLDTDKIEKNRGITIFSKQARLNMGSKEIVLLDTPGHVDFSAEMEMTLQVLDYAVLVISGTDGVQSHTATVWKLLEHYGIPVFIFVNKMDQPDTDRKNILKDLKKRLSDSCVDFTEQHDESFMEELSLCSEELLEQFLDNALISGESIAENIRCRHIFPCYFGSALKLEGVDEFIKGFDEFTIMPEYPEEFAAKVYKISRDSKENRLTHMKITGGSLRVKELINGEKADQIRFYSGMKFVAGDEASAGDICTVTGLNSTYSGQGLGTENMSETPVLEPVFSYRVITPDGCDVHQLLLKMKLLEEESPHLHVSWDSKLKEIYVTLMGEIELEILKSVIRDRFDINVEFGKGNILYKETIKESVIGTGHFEPLKHYAEVHLLLEPGERGSGMRFASECSTDTLSKNWQRLILTHLEEKKHIGVLTGSEITDIKISIVGGRAHEKHTEGGDFREATYRAVRQGLMRADSVLLEPFYEFRLELPVEMLGRAISDVQRMNGHFESPDIEGETVVIRGYAPVAEMQNYQTEINSYTQGKGRMFCSFKGYDVCENAEAVIAEKAYDAERDVFNPAGSVFCMNGAGNAVSWQEVEKYAHTESEIRLTSESDKTLSENDITDLKLSHYEGYADEEELEAIFLRTYGKSKKDEERRFRKKSDARVTAAPVKYRTNLNLKKREKFLLVDGYNIIFAWDELKELSDINLEAARNSLADILSNYQGYKNDTLIIVFDAYKVKGNPGSVEKYHNIYIIYTKESQTADQYIERAVHKMGGDYDITVATSDNLEQMISWGDGAKCISAAQLKEDVEKLNAEMREKFLNNKKEPKNRPFEKLLK